MTIISMTKIYELAVMALCLFDSGVMSNHPIDVRYVAQLARLELTDEECARFQPQLDAILSHAESLSRLNVKGVEPMAHPVPVHDVMRDDRAHASLAPEVVLANSPDQAQGQIRVPKVIAEA